MSNVPAISTSTYLKTRNVSVDGNIWALKAPGAKQELALSQSQRRLKRLDQKIEDGSADDADYDLYDKLEMQTYNMFKDIFKDSTDGNKQVTEWLENTPLAVVMQSFEDLSKQIENKGNDDTTGTTSEA